MNFVAGKIGLTIRFNWKNTDTGWFSAADDLARLVVNLSYNNPNDNFYLIGPNDVNDMPLATRTRLFPNNNVISAYDKKRGFDVFYSSSSNQRPYNSTYCGLFVNHSFKFLSPFDKLCSDHIGIRLSRLFIVTGLVTPFLIYSETDTL